MGTYPQKKQAVRHVEIFQVSLVQTCATQTVHLPPHTYTRRYIPFNDRITAPEFRLLWLLLRGISAAAGTFALSLIRVNQPSKK